MEPSRHARAGTDAPFADPLVGRLLDGRYRIGPRIARGGMASVYEATDLRLDRTVAVKVMHPGLGDDEEFAARFVREARAAARLSHPHVVAVHDQGDDNGTIFLAMELVPGHTLRDVVRKEAPMSPLRALALLEPVLSALATAHRAGLVHRDVKPENVLISDDGRVKVADFGLAKAISADTQHTATGGVLIGTVSYLAPELVVEGRADARADVYAAGVMLYELLTGAKPHEGESPIHVAYQHVHADVPPPSRRTPGIPPYVDALVARATARDRGQRPADAGVLLHQVHRVHHALAAGVPDDPDLTADLALLTRAHDTAEGIPAVPARSGDTAADPWDAEAMAALLAPSPGDATSSRTTAIPTPGRRPSSGSSAAPTRSGGSRRSRRAPVLTLLALVLAVTAGAGAYWFGWARYTATPGVIGDPQAVAVRQLEAAGFEVGLERDHSETVAAGEVLDSEPGAGSRILDGGTVVLTVSLGKERYDVPALRGMTEEEARAALADLRLEPDQSRERWSETVPAGTVLTSEPAAGTTLRPGAAVDLVLSKGRRPISVRDWTGRDAERARAFLEGRGLRVEVRGEEYSDTVPEGAVLAQSPRAGRLFRNDTVSLTVSLGPELVEVPGGLVASGVEAATDRLTALGFEVEVEEDLDYIGLGYVFRASPGSGEMVPRGATITLYLI